MFFNKGKKNQRSSPGQSHARNEPSYVGKEMLIEGQVNCDGELHIDGIVRGSVRAKLCVVDKQGLVQGELAADVLHVRGRVIGPISGLNVFIYAGAHVEGDVFNETISIENGAFVYGSIRHNTPPQLPPGQPERQLVSALGAQPIAIGMESKTLRVVQTRK